MVSNYFPGAFSGRKPLWIISTGQWWKSSQAVTQPYQNYSNQCSTLPELPAHVVMLQRLPALVMPFLWNAYFKDPVTWISYIPPTPKLTYSKCCNPRSFIQSRTPVHWWHKVFTMSQLFVSILPFLTVPPTKVLCYSLCLSYATQQTSSHLLLYSEFIPKCLNITEKWKKQFYMALPIFVYESQTRTLYLTINNIPILWCKSLHPICLFSTSSFLPVPIY